ncbi:MULTISPECIES: stalk domain-containing protein [Paenibacillus]|uniref:stalk domain-containing protein n=1 Tax=Paenibacillus TaxID=44249 RepID=UPI00037FA862|nr:MULTISPECIES: stalk domain-containing protein [Paenibacillus]
MKKLVTGVLTAALLFTGSSVYAASSNVYELTEATYPIMVNGKEYNDSSLPALSYKGSTYIPLANIASLTGVKYKWNSSLKQVEIGNSGNSAAITDPDAQVLNQILSRYNGPYSFEYSTEDIPPASPPTTYNDWINQKSAKESALESVLQDVNDQYYLAYELTEVTYPVLVNGQPYNDAKHPILNFQNSTYIPLAKIGELTGVDYKWNSTLKQVEIHTAK